MNISDKTILILFQIDNLYRSEGMHGLYDLVYDKLKEDGFEVKYNKVITNEIWQKSKKKFAKENKRLIGVWPEEKLKLLLNKYMKSMLVSKYLLDKIKTEGCMILSDEVTGQQIKFLNIVGYDNNSK